MPKHPPGESQANDFWSSPAVVALLSEYEKSWHRVEQGAEPPDADSFISRVGPDWQPELSRRLNDLDQTFQTRLVPKGNDPTHAGGVDATMEFSNEEVADDDNHDATMDFTSESMAPSDTASENTQGPNDATMDFGTAVDDRTQNTIDFASSEDLDRETPESDGTEQTIDTLGQEVGRATKKDAVSPAPKKKRRSKASRKVPTVPGYEIIDELGRGGMGVVYRAKQAGLDRTVALKMILGGGHVDPTQLQRFRDEAQAVAQLQHANIVQVFDVGEQDGLPYFSLEFVDGSPLDEQIKEQPLDGETAARIVEKTSRAMQYAHDNKIVHRDLKPANILMTTDGEPKVSDFGLVKRLESDSGQTRTGTIMGTPSYMAPEQARDTAGVGPSADVYALGAVLYCLLTGRPPFMASQPLETLAQVLNDEPVPPTRLQPTIPVDLETICLKCLQKDITKRYESASQLADDLSRYLKGEPISARPVSKAERAWRWCRRNPKIAIPTSLAGLLGAALMVGGPAAAIAINQQKAAAVSAKAEAETNATLAQKNEALATKNATEARQNEERAIASEQEAKRNEARAVASEQKAKENEEQAVAARDEARTNAQAATAQKIAALEAARGIVIDVQKEIENRPRLQWLRQQMLNHTLVSLNRISANDGKVTQVDLPMAKAYRLMGDLYLEVGQPKKSLEMYAKSFAVAERMDEQHALPNPEQNFGNLYEFQANAAAAASELDKAEELYSNALEKRQQWLKVDSGRRNLIERNIANSLGDLGRIALLFGDAKKAGSYYQQSFDLRQELVQRQPKSSSARMQLAGSYAALGSVAKKNGLLDKASELMLASLEIQEELASKRTDDEVTQYNLALFRNRLGHVLLMGDKPDEAEPLYQKAADVLSAIREADPEHAGKAEHLANAYYGLATALAHRQQDDDSLAVYEKSLELHRQLVAQDPNNTTKSAVMVLALARCQKRAEALQMADKIYASETKNPRVLYLLAGGYALASALPATKATEVETEQQPESPAALRNRAVDVLAEAIKHGYHVNQQLTFDPDMIPIHQHPGFIKLVTTK